jgi:hypothetical protein
MSYPKWKYHASKEPTIVNSEADEKALGNDWGESPAEFEEVSSSPSHQSAVIDVEYPASISKPKKPKKGNN